MSDIYDQHKAAFAQVSAFVVINPQGERIATVALKFPRDGAGRLYAYVHQIGTEMVRGYAGGYGYDKRSAAVASAIAKLKPYDTGYVGEDFYRVFEETRAALQVAAKAMDSGDWQREIERALPGHRVFQAV